MKVLSECRNIETAVWVLCFPHSDIEHQRIGRSTTKLDAEIVCREGGKDIYKRESLPRRNRSALRRGELTARVSITFVFLLPTPARTLYETDRMQNRYCLCSYS